MENSAMSQPAGEESQAENGESSPERGAEGYRKSESLGFCPQKELNLPANYDEVVERFKRLQAGRAMESLN
jgi:hypothetical protein